VAQRSWPRHPPPARQPGRLFVLVAGVLALVVWLAPPLASLARRFEFVEAIQFAFFAVVVPALVVMGSPWSLLGLASPRPPLLDDDGGPHPPTATLRWADRLASARRRHPEAVRSACFAGLALAGAIFWRTPFAVDALARHPWALPLEAASLLGVGVGLWLELVESPPLTPRLPRPSRIALAAIIMWTIWILAYLVGLSHGSWYPAYPHHPGGTLSLSADQQLTTGVMWFISACAFVPVVFSNLIRWLQSEEDPDEELHHLIRQERIRGRTLGPDPSAPWRPEIG
jgi:cytochrome c oxidase assembly factor CtaG